MKLYELTDAYVSLLAQYDDAATEAEQLEILEAIGNVETDIVGKAESIARIIRNKEAEEKALDEEIKRLTAKKKAAQNAIKGMKENVLFAMGVAGAREIKTTIGKWWIQKNPWSVTVTDEAAVPARFLIEQPPKIDARAIIEEYKMTGEIMPGVEVGQSEGVRFR